MIENLKAKIPPQAIELEKVVLGGLMIDGKAIEIVSGYLKPEVFYLPSHRSIFKAIAYLFETNNPIDILTVDERLKKTGMDKTVGIELLIELSQSVSSTAHILQHVGILVERYIRREVIKVSNRVLGEAYSDEVSPKNLLENIGQMLSGIEELISTDTSSQTWEEALTALPDDVRRLSDN